ncbi:MAG: hypothetical protein H6591_08785 [Flavobacteriales bacterium]|nr:hypothetical protein [Flavobacteriales bacterium]
MAPWRLLRISALAAGTLMLLFLLWMLIGHLTGDANGPNGMRFNGTKEVIAFTFFPCITIVGLALAYWRPLLGGGIAAGSIVALFTLRPDLLASPFIVTLVPGLLYVAHGGQSRRSI